jgi:outer membrane protein TolC
MRTAVSQEKVAEAEKQSARLLLSSAIARSWLQLARQYQQLALSEQQLAVREKIDQLTLQRLKAGLKLNLKFNKVCCKFPVSKTISSAGKKPSP